MFGKAEAVTMDMLKTALDAASLRHQAIANNIANVNTAGYRPASVNFEQQMDAVRSTLAQGKIVQPDMLRGVQPFIERLAPVTDADRTALLDTEVGNMAQNTVQYEALLKAMGKHISILSSAIAEGKR
ncbi:flagellar basal body rod protein FlgB [Undibacterium sp. YM2]|uniref:flagellar basal body rod protein FlgB n=1 Tax=Undibacterium sp. YM2 TaxID=2058625 RepID=UPI00138A2261|nr:flagellar basal body rod protein FlgB [Undibacterium sp. YM2]